MKKNIAVVVVLVSLSILFHPANAFARVTSGYFKSNGTYVKPYRSTNPNSTKLDNWSTKGNYNPYTGSKGYVNPWR